MENETLNDIMDESLNYILINLRVLSNIGVQDKLCTYETPFNLHSPSAWRSAYRFIYRESRVKNLQDIENCIYEAKKHPQFPRIKSALKSVPTGLLRLANTYRDDATLYSRILVLIDNINILCKEDALLSIPSSPTSVSSG